MNCDHPFLSSPIIPKFNSRTFHSMKTPALLAAALLAVPAGLSAQVVMPGLSGFQRLTLPGNSDSFLSTPYARPEAASGLLGSITGSDISFMGTPGWTPGQFVFAEGVQNNSYYLLILSGPNPGATFPITGNTADTLTVNPGGESTAGLAAGQRAAIIPYWTLATLFPGGTGVHASASPSTRSSEVLFPNHNALTINASSSRTFYFGGGVWQEVGQGTAVRDHVTILPDSYFIVRHNIAASTTFECAGSVLTQALRVPIGVNPTAKRDNYLGLQRPAGVTLAASGLVSSGAFAASPSPGNRTDELFVYNNSTAVKNRSASAIYYYWNNAWRKVGSGTVPFDNTAVFTPGAGFIIRKNATGTSPTWINLPNY